MRILTSLLQRPLYRVRLGFTVQVRIRSRLESGSGLELGSVVMVKVRVMGQGMCYASESPHRDRGTRMCVQRKMECRHSETHTCTQTHKLILSRADYTKVHTSCVDTHPVTQMIASHAHTHTTLCTHLHSDSHTHIHLFCQTQTHTYLRSRCTYYTTIHCCLLSEKHSRCRETHTFTES